MFYSLSFAQSASDMGVLPMPDKFNKYMLESYINKIYAGAEPLDPIIEPASVNTPWVVYSDRNKNIYTDYVNGTKQGQLDIGNRLHVFEVQGSYLKVGWVTAADGRSWNKVIYGWMHADQLILSPFAVLTDKGGPKKAMVLTTVSSFNPNDDFEDMLTKKHFYKDPKCVETNISKNKATKFRFLFVYKSNVGYSQLMTNTDNLSLSTNSKANIRGWLQNGKVTDWNNRVCLEPNSSLEAVRAYKGKKIYVIDDANHFERFLSSGSLSNDEWAIREVELQARRPFAELMRMPILEWNYQTPNKKKIAAIAQIITPSVECPCPDGTESEDCCDEGTPDPPNINDKEQLLAKSIAQLTKIKNKRNNVNLLFVLDGTRSMKDFGPAIARSIKNFLRKQLGETDDKYRFGLAIYRHYDDEEVPKAPLFEFIPLQAEANDIIEKLESLKYDSRNKPHPESHYYGMKEAIKQAKFDKKQTNVLILVGDAGNIRNDERGIRKEEIIDLLYENEINLLSFQVNFVDHVAYSTFNMDVNSYMKKSGELHLKDYPYYSKCTGKPVGDNTIKLTFVPKDSNDKASEEFLPIFGKFKYSDIGEEMDVKIFEKILESSLSEYVALAEKLERTYERAIEGDRTAEGIVDDGADDSSGGSEDRVTEKFPEAFVAKLKADGFSDLQIEIFKRQGEVSAHGYVALKTGGIDVPAFVPVIFISKDFKDEIDKRFEIIIGQRDVETNQARDYLYNSMIGVVQAIMGRETSKKWIEKQTFNQVWQLILGVEFNGEPMLKNLKIYEIRQQLDDELIDEFFDNFTSQVEDFIQTEYDDDFTRWERANQIYYWIPLSDVPGCE